MIHQNIGKEMEKFYKLIHTGKLLPNFEYHTVIDNASTTFKISEENAKKLIGTGKASVLKKKISHEKAIIYKERLEKLGIEIRLVRIEAESKIQVAEVSSEATSEGATLDVEVANTPSKRKSRYKAKQIGIIIISVLVLSGLAGTLYFQWLESRKDFLQSITENKYYKKDYIFKMVITDDQRYIAISRSSGLVQWFDTHDRKSRPHDIKAHGKYINELAISKNGNYLATNSSAEQITRIWQRENGHLIKEFPEMDGPVIFMHDETRVIAASTTSRYGYGLTIYNIETDTIEGKYGGDQIISSLALSEDEKYLAVGGANDISLMEVKRSETSVELVLLQSASFHERPNAETKEMMFSKTNDTLITGSSGGCIDVWGVPLLQEKKHFQSVLHEVETFVFVKDEQDPFVAIIGRREYQDKSGQAEQVFLSDWKEFILWRKVSYRGHAVYLSAYDRFLFTAHSKFYSPGYRKRKKE